MQRVLCVFWEGLSHRIVYDFLGFGGTLVVMGRCDRIARGHGHGIVYTHDDRTVYSNLDRFLRSLSHTTWVQ